MHGQKIIKLYNGVNIICNSCMMMTSWHLFIIILPSDVKKFLLGMNVEER